MRRIWLLNSLLNLSGRSGKFLGVDEVNEYIVKELKFTYNPRNTWQTKKFHMETLSRLIMIFTDLKRAVLSTSGAPNGGGRHSAVHDKRDVGMILHLLVKEKVMCQIAGRTTCGPRDGRTSITESIDSWSRVLLDPSYICQS